MPPPPPSEVLGAAVNGGGIIGGGNSTLATPPTASIVVVGMGGRSGRRRYDAAWAFMVGCEFLPVSRHFSHILSLNFCEFPPSPATFRSWRLNLTNLILIGARP